MARTLREELKQARPFSSLEQETHLGILRTAACISHELSEVIRAHGLTLTQYNTLRILRGAEPHGLSRSAIRERLVTEVPDVTRLLDRMEEAGLVRRERGGEDRRFVNTRITTKGLVVLDQLEEPVSEAHKAMLGHMGKERLRELLRILDEIRNRD